MPASLEAWMRESPYSDYGLVDLMPSVDFLALHPPLCDQSNPIDEKNPQEVALQARRNAIYLLSLSN
jgi:hypothetical protein